MSPDPNLFLSTIAASSAALVAIVGGLLVARFIGLDSDQRRSRTALKAARGRLEIARSRAMQAHNRFIQWEARDFLEDGGVMSAIRDGVTDLDELRALASCSLDDDDLRRVVAATGLDFDAARNAMDANPPTEDELTAAGRGWDDYKQRVVGTRSSRAWQIVFSDQAWELQKERQRERERERRAAQPPGKNPFESLGVKMADLAKLSSPIDPRQYFPEPLVPTSPIAARRYDEVRAQDERAQQRVEDYENELERLETEHGEIARPTGWLWAAVAILAFFAVIGIGLPVGLMSAGPTDLKSVSWVVVLFLVALAFLLGYIVLYLKQLTRKGHSGKPS